MDGRRDGREDGLVRRGRVDRMKREMSSTE